MELKKKLQNALAAAEKQLGKCYAIEPVDVHLGRGLETVHHIDTIGKSYYNASTLHSLSWLSDENEIRSLIENVEEATKIGKLSAETAQYAVEHITRKGMHTGIAWFSDSFNELCDATPDQRIDPDDIGFDFDDVKEAIKRDPWIQEIAAKPAEQLTKADIDRVVKDFISKNWLMDPGEVDTKDVADVLKVADPTAHRREVALDVMNACNSKLNEEQMDKLEGVLKELVNNPSLGQSRGIGR
ncbi:MAG: hypothetical protein J5770_06630 [Bacteroidaceae bacterium]|nr:hypothetical protein [Bacteroidaceae bacterium]